MARGVRRRPGVGVESLWGKGEEDLDGITKSLLVSETEDAKWKTPSLRTSSGGAEKKGRKRVMRSTAARKVLGSEGGE